jgi:poly(A) polymerase
VVSRKKGLSEAAVEAAGGKIFTYGSYRLGVYGPGSDIDTLVVGPKQVLIDDFFSDFPPVLERMAPPGAIEKMTPVPDAYVPIIKLELSGISIDLIFARLIIPSIPINLDLKNNDYLRGLDEREVRSLNGTRVTDEILELVPQQKTFRLALRAIKLWAQRRAIYSNIVGFPGGVAWAMLVARVCQLYPQATGSVIVGKFFRIMNKWAWPQPVLLKPIEDGPLQIKVWNPKIYHGDRFHLMPIITPAYPSMCATHNVSMSTKNVILRELQRGGDMVDKIFMKQLTWNDLFARHSFFTKDYKYYLRITAASTTKEADSVWSGLVESKIRHLVGALDRKPTIAVAHPFPKGFERIHVVSNEQEAEAVKNGSTAYQDKGQKTQMTDETNDPAHQAAAQDQIEKREVADTVEAKPKGESWTIYTTTYYIGLEMKPQPPGTFPSSPP